jgi:hypothetical protein
MQLIVAYVLVLIRGQDRVAEVPPRERRLQIMGEKALVGHRRPRAGVVVCTSTPTVGSTRTQTWDPST